MLAKPVSDRANEPFRCFVPEDVDWRRVGVDRTRDEEDGTAKPALMPRVNDERQRRVGLADADVDRHRSYYGSSGRCVARVNFSNSPCPASDIAL